MTVFPSVQEKVRAEIDRVVGFDWRPTLDDLEDMPYLRAVVVENYIWCPLTSGDMQFSKSCQKLDPVHFDETSRRFSSHIYKG